MLSTIFPITLILATLLCTMVAGFLFGFAVVAMPGIKNLNDGEFIRAFQVMDAVIQNNQPLFMLVWMGSILVLLISAGIGFGQLDVTGRILLISATLLYLFGVQLPTIMINVPLNNQLQSMTVDRMNEDDRKTAASILSHAGISGMLSEQLSQHSHPCS